jgi:hypothetical protein
MYVYLNSEPGLYTAGFHSADGRWHPESDHDAEDKAARRVAELNGTAELAELRRVNALLVAALERIAQFDEYEPAGPAALTARAALAEAEKVK